jgi:F0F1-type ATP synthase assembly protein I
MYKKSGKRSSVLFIAFAVFATWILHEGGHWLAGTLLGYNTTMTLNGTSARNGIRPGADLFWFDLSGPLVTYFEAAIAFFLLLRKRSANAYALLLICTYMRCLATVVSLLNLNDEARISKNLGLGAVTLPLLVCAVLIFLTRYSAKKNGYGTRTTLVTIGWIMLFSSLLVLADMKWHPKLL